MYKLLIFLASLLYVTYSCQAVQILNVRQCQRPANFSEAVKAGLRDAASECEPSPAKARYYLTLIRAGKFICDYVFKKFLYCCFSKSGYINPKTGLVYPEPTASVYRGDSAVVLKAIKFCNKYASSDKDPIEAVSRFSQCFEIISPALINAL